MRRHYALIGATWITSAVYRVCAQEWPAWQLASEQLRIVLQTDGQFELDRSTAAPLSATHVARLLSGESALPNAAAPAVSASMVGRKAAVAGGAASVLALPDTVAVVWVDSVTSLALAK